MAESAQKKQHNIEYIAIAALVAVAVIIGITRFKKSDANDEVFSREEFNKRWKEVEIIEANVPAMKKEAVAFAPPGDTPPFKSPFDEIKEDKPVDENITLPTMAFQGMVWKSSRPQAIINNKVYDVNDVVMSTDSTGDVRVKSIDKEGIHLTYKGKEFIVRPK
ncbi:MAG: hypothetical protein Q8O12_04560 [Candidatus Omnitrophota bacterium]|nr:hypothetical protein [Candidatus Omnitrophota bacterium]